MKPKLALRSFLLGCSSLLAASSIHAADVTWDIDPGTVGVGNGTITGATGTWNLANGNWTVDAGANNVAWDDGNNDIAIFSDTGGTVTLGTDINLSGLEFTTSGYTIDGGGNKLILGNNGGIRSSNNPPSTLVGSATINADIDTNGFRLTVVGGTSVLSGDISGSGGFATYNNSTVTLSGDNTYTGKTDITSDTTSGSSLTVSSLNSVAVPAPMASSSLGVPVDASAGTILIGNSGKRCSCTLTYTGTGETTDRVVRLEFNDTSSQTIQASGSGLLKFTSPFTSNATGQKGAFILRGTGDAELVEALPPVPSAGSIGVRKLDSGTWTLGGTSTVNNTVRVEAGTLTIDGQLNTASTLNITGGTLNGTGSLGFDIDGTTADQVIVTGGTLDISGLAAEIIPGGGSGLDQSEYVLVDATGVGYTGTFTGFAGTAPAGYELNYDTTDQVKLVSTGGPSDPFADWSVLDGATGVTFDGDANGDGVQDGLAFLLGAANPNIDANAAELLPTVTETGGGLVLTFSCLNDASNGDNTLNVEYSSDLGVIDTWTAVLVPDTTPDPQATDVTFTVNVNGLDSDLNDVVATISSAEADGGKLFGRLQAPAPTP